MELKNLIEVFAKHIRLIVISTLVFGLMGALYFYYFPQVYKATGSLYVSRGVEAGVRTDFTYEGFYAQQASSNYTGTLIGLLESVDIRTVALEDLGIEVTEQTLRESAKNIEAKKAAPQLVTLTTKALSPDLASAFWKVLTNGVIGTSNVLNSEFGDPTLTVIPVSESPVVYAAFRNLYVSIAVGGAFGLGFGAFLASLKEYLS